MPSNNTNLRIPDKKTIKTPSVVHLRMKGFKQGPNRNMSVKGSGPTKPRRK
jgi:hypothetical protein